MPADRPGTWATLGALAGLGFTWACAIALGYLLGAWADTRLGSSPWLVLAGVLAGSAAGFVELFRILRRLEGRGPRP